MLEESIQTNRRAFERERMIMSDTRIFKRFKKQASAAVMRLTCIR